MVQRLLESSVLPNRIMTSGEMRLMWPPEWKAPVKPDAYRYVLDAI